MFSILAPWFGYIAFVLLALGLVMSSDLKFRWFNAGGCLAFVIYGILIQAIPVILTNGILLVINIVYLYKILHRKELFEHLEFQEGGPLVDRFLAFYQKDIVAYFPEFRREQLTGNFNFVVLRDLVIANIFSARLHEDGSAEILLNYTVPRYRDYKVGRFIFEEEKEFLLSKGVKRLYYTNVANRSHEHFLGVMHFTPTIVDGRRQFSLVIAN